MNWKRKKEIGMLGLAFVFAVTAVPSFADVLYATSFDIGEGYVGGLIGGQQGWVTGPFGSSPYLNDRGQDGSRVFSGNRSVALVNTVDQSIYQDINVDPTIKKVWIEAYFMTTTDAGAARIGLLDPDDNTVQAAAGLSGFTFSAVGTSNVTADQTGVVSGVNSWVHIVLEVDYDAGTLTTYGKGIAYQDATPLTTGDILTYNDGASTTVALDASPSDSAARLYIEGTSGLWGFVDTIAVYDVSPIVSVPEPATMSLLVLGAIGMFARRRK